MECRYRGTNWLAPSLMQKRLVNLGVTDIINDDSGFDVAKTIGSGTSLITLQSPLVKKAKACFMTRNGAAEIHDCKQRLQSKNVPTSQPTLRGGLLLSLSSLLLHSNLNMIAKQLQSTLPALTILLSYSLFKLMDFTFFFFTRLHK